MSLKSIRDSYGKLLTAFADTGIKLTEAQKASLDTFILALESKMSKQKEATVKATKKVVTEHLEKQYKKVFESIMTHMQENAILANKIQTKITKINENKQMAKAVDNYLNLYVESVLPKKTIVDYDRMQKLENVFESLKDTLLVNEESVQKKQEQLKESYDKAKSKLETQIAKLQVKLNENMKKNLALNKKIDSLKAVELLESKTKDLPIYEAKLLKKRFADATTTEIEKNFKKVYESIKSDIEKEENETETSIEEEVKDILEGEDVALEDDLLRGKKHNLDKDGCDILGTKHNAKNAHAGHGTINPLSEEEEENDEAEEDYSQSESVEFDENGDVCLNESDIRDQAYMTQWSNSINRYCAK